MDSAVCLSSSWNLGMSPPTVTANILGLTSSSFI